MERRLPFILIAAGIALFLASFLFFAAPKACAAEVANSSLDRIVTLYRDKASSWETTLKNYALTLFFLLAAIEFAVSAIRLAFRGSDASEWLAELVNQVLFLGFFLALLNNSSAWAKAIVNSFRAAANQAAISSGGSSNLAPSDIFDTGLSIASKVADQTSLFSPASSFGLIVCALVILIAFALIAAFLIVSLVESYVVISAGVLLMGFGGSRFTKDYAVRTMTYAVSVGAKLFVLQLLIALGQQIFQSLSQSFEAKTTDIFVVVGSAIVMLALVKIVPEMIQALINGASVGSSPLLASAAAIAGGAAALSGMAYGAGMVVRSAGRLASDQLADARLNGTAAPTAFGRGLQFTAATARNIARAAVENIGDRLSGRAHFGTRLGQMSDERLIAEGQTLLERRQVFEYLRDRAGEHYQTLTGSAWRPRSGSLVNHAKLTASLLDSREYLSAKRRDETEVHLPKGTRIAFSGGAACNDHKHIWQVLDETFAHYPSMVLLHGGTPRGAERIAACWADSRKVTQIVFKPDWDRDGKAAPFKRNDALLAEVPQAVIVFPGTGITDNLADKAKKLGIRILDHRKQDGA